MKTARPAVAMKDFRVVYSWHEGAEEKHGQTVVRGCSQADGEERLASLHRHITVERSRGK